MKKALLIILFCLANIFTFSQVFVERVPKQGEIVFADKNNFIYKEFASEDYYLKVVSTDKNENTAININLGKSSDVKTSIEILIYFWDVSRECDIIKINGNRAYIHKATNTISLKAPEHTYGQYVIKIKSLKKALKTIKI